MRKLASVCIDRPVFASMIILALVVVGASAFFRLGVDRFPVVDLPTVRIQTLLPGASVEEVESQVSDIIEEAVNRVEGINELRSVSSPGQSMVLVTFNLERDIDTAAQDVRDRVANVLRRLPNDVEPPLVGKMDSDQAPTLSVAVRGNRSARELTEIADKTVKVQLERSKGVGEVALVGGLQRSINIWVEADRLAAYQLPISQVRAALQQQNADIPGGNVTTDANEQTLRTMGRFTESADFNDLVIATREGAPIRIRDIGYAEDGTKEVRTYARVNGQPTVILDVRRQSGANTVEVVEAARQSLERVKPQLPPGVEVEIVRDTSQYIYAALHEINVHLVLGSILACLVVFAFMRDWRATLIAAVAIPASVVSTFGLMAALGFTLNTVTMLALVLMIGIVIDDAIVVLENIFRFIEEKKVTPFEAAREATAEIALPVMATTLCLVVIFIPVSFMSSVSGRFLYQFGITAACAILVSLLVSFTLTPMMSARMFRREDDDAVGHDAAHSRQGFYHLIDLGYAGALGWAMRHRALIAVGGVAVMLLTIPLAGVVRREFLPTGIDEAQFEMQITAPEGTAAVSMNEVMHAWEVEMQKMPEVRLILSTVGGGFNSAVNEGQMFVKIAPHEERIFSIARFLKGIVTLRPLEAFRANYSQRDVMARIRGIGRKYPDLRVAVRNLQTFNLGGGNNDMDFVIRGPDLEALATYTEALRARSTELGLVDADTTLKLNKPELRVLIDRARAADMGVSTQDVAESLRLMVGGDQEVTRYRDPSLNEDYDVQLRLVDRDRTDPAMIAGLYVARNTGEMIRLDNLVRFEQGRSPSRVDRQDRQRQANLRSGIAPGFGLADRLDALRAAAGAMNLPPAYTTAVAGRAREFERTISEFGWAFLLSIIFMYMVLAAQYESLLNPFVILLSLPLSLPFALLSLYLMRDTLNLYSALGMLVLFGVVAKNAILQIDHTLNLRRQGLPRGEAILGANRDRLRPILMTTLALVGGMLPLALGTGAGAEERRTIAVVVIGGQTLSLFLTLIMIPVAYAIVDDAAEWVRARRQLAEVRTEVRT